MLLRSYGCRSRARTSSRLLVFPCCAYARRSALAEFLARLEAEHGDPVAAFDHLTLAIRNYHNSDNTTTIRIPLAIVVCKETGCGRQAHSPGWCTTHYRRWRSGQAMDAPIRRCARRVRPKRKRPFERITPMTSRIQPSQTATVPAQAALEPPEAADTREAAGCRLPRTGRRRRRGGRTVAEADDHAPQRRYHRRRIRCCQEAAPRHLTPTLANSQRPQLSGARRAIAELGAAQSVETLRCLISQVSPSGTKVSR